MPDAAPVLDHHDLILRPDPSRTVVRPCQLEHPGRCKLADHRRAPALVDRVMTLDEARLDCELKLIVESRDERHRDVDAMLLRRFAQICPMLEGKVPEDNDRRRLVGAYLSEECSFEAAAVFNPSAVMAPDQSNAPEGGCRFILSLRGIGEGHVSSVTFRTGHWVPGGYICVDTPSETAVPPRIDGEDVERDKTVELRCDDSRDISETVLFPLLPRQRQGIEDLRLVRFVEEDGTATYHGTYTAYSGAEAKPELLSTDDFSRFTMCALSGDAAGAKGMALFPRRVGGQYAMLGRQDSESIWLHRSDTLLDWSGGGKVVSPCYPWELVQMGNCGSPIEIDEGWLVFTHGVGTVRNYCMGACLLDKGDPSKLLARTPQPILAPSAHQRERNVPNVVYSCGVLLHGRELMVPFSVADNFAAFATTTVARVLAAME